MMRLVWETKFETGEGGLKIVSKPQKNNRVLRTVLFAAKSRRRVEKARDKAKIFIASKTDTRIDSEEFIQALKFFDVNEMKELFPCLYITREIYDTEGGGYATNLKEGKDYIVIDTFTKEWYYVIDAAFDEVDESGFRVYTPQKIKLGEGYPFWN